MTLPRHPHPGIYWTLENVERYAASIIRLSISEEDSGSLDEAIHHLVSHLGCKVVRLDDLVAPVSEEVKATVDEIKAFIVEQRTVKDCYSVREFAASVKRSEYQVRKWCREGRIEAHKLSGAGPEGKEHWAIPHSALEYYRNRKLLPR